MRSALWLVPPSVKLAPKMTMSHQVKIGRNESTREDGITTPAMNQIQMILLVVLIAI